MDDLDDARMHAMDEDLNDPSKDREGTPSSLGSSPDVELEQDRSKDANAPPMKRKGGRKPIYATSEERKQRNRQAQAAFRERRTEYIKQLEATIKQNEETLATLQQNHRSAADECLMLRYKNSLLERILLEKGVDVQAELHIKAGSPAFPASMMSPGMGMSQMQARPLQRAAVQRHHARRSANIITSNFNADGTPQLDINAVSPQAVPTPSSHTTSSPSMSSVRSPIAGQPSGMTPPSQQQFQAGARLQPMSLMSPDSLNGPVRQLQSNPYLAQPQRRPSGTQHQSTASVASNRSTSSHQSGQNAPIPKPLDTTASLAVQNASTFYPSPFQKHIDQLEQEYDTQDASQSMLDQLEPDPNDREHLSNAYTSQHNYQNPYPYPQQLTPHSQNEQSHMSPTTQLPTDLIDPHDPMLDADPFGLTASMHYPTSYSFEHRRLIATATLFCPSSKHHAEDGHLQHITQETMSQIASKNLYELLGNDPELDPDREPEPPTKAIDKPVQRTGKRNAGAEAPAVNGDRPSAGGRGGRQANFVRGDQAGTGNNRAEQRDDGLRHDRHPKRDRDPRDHRGVERGRGPRGERRGRGRGDFGGTRTARDDRHSHTGIGEHEKQAAHGWGAENAGAELDDERAGDAIAAAETKNEPGAEADARDPAFSSGPDLAGEDGEVNGEAEDKTKSYDQYLADLAEKRLALSGSSLEIRQANEGSKQNFPEGKAHAREEADYFAGAGGKTARQKETKQKNLFTVDGQYYAPIESGDRGRGGRGGARGGRGRGEGRGEFRGRGGRGRGEGRGSFRGERNDAPRGARGGFNANDQSAFPALGGN